MKLTMTSLVNEVVAIIEDDLKMVKLLTNPDIIKQSEAYGHTAIDESYVLNLFKKIAYNANGTVLKLKEEGVAE